MNICLCFKKRELFTIPFFLLHLSNLMLGKIKNKVLPFSHLCMKIVTHIQQMNEYYKTERKLKIRGENIKERESRKKVGIVGKRKGK